MSLQRHDRQERNQIERQDNSICEQSSPGSTRHGYTATNEGCQRILNTMTVIHAPQRPARARKIVRDRSGGSVWESNPPFWPRRTESMALKATRTTGPLAPPSPDYSVVALRHQLQCGFAGCRKRRFFRGSEL